MRAAWRRWHRLSAHAPPRGARHRPGAGDVPGDRPACIGLPNLATCRACGALTAGRALQPIGHRSLPPPTERLRAAAVVRASTCWRGFVRAGRGGSSGSGLACRRAPARALHALPVVCACVARVLWVFRRCTSERIACGAQGEHFALMADSADGGRPQCGRRLCGPQGASTAPELSCALQPSVSLWRRRSEPKASALT